MTGYLVHWSQKPTLGGLNSAVLLVFMLLTLASVLFFFVPALDSAITVNSSESTQNPMTEIQSSRYSDNFIEANYLNDQILIK